MSETWRVIPGAEAYEVSDLGRVRSNLHKTPRILSPGRNVVNEYEYVSLKTSTGTRRKWVHVHRVVLLAFVGPMPAGMQTRHLDGNRTNNRLDNLAYGTPVENAADKLRHGTDPHSLGRTGRRTPRDIRPGELRIPEAAKRLGYSPNRVTKLCAEGKLPARRSGGQWLIHGDALAAYVRPPIGRPRHDRGAA